MMIHAYQECYLNSAKRNIGIAFDYAINVCKISGADFLNMFLISIEGKESALSVLPIGNNQKMSRPARRVERVVDS